MGTMQEGHGKDPDNTETEEYGPEVLEALRADPVAQEPVCEVPLTRGALETPDALEAIGGDMERLMDETTVSILLGGHRTGSGRDAVREFRERSLETRKKAGALLFAADPVRYIRAMNLYAYSRMDGDDSLIDALNVEVLLDWAVFDHSGRRLKGMPRYLPDGFVDMGKDPKLEGRYGRREKYGMRKADNMDIMLKAKKMALEGGDVIRELADLSREGLSYSETGLMEAVEERGGVGNTIYVRHVRRKGKGVCRNTDIIFQMLAQTAGVESYVAKAPGHTYNFAVDGDHLVLVDPTPSREGQEADPEIMGFKGRMRIDRERMKRGYHGFLREAFSDVMEASGFTENSWLWNRYMPRDLVVVPNYFKVNGR